MIYYKKKEQYFIYYKNYQKTKELELSYYNKNEKILNEIKRYKEMICKLKDENKILKDKNTDIEKSIFHKY